MIGQWVAVTFIALGLGAAGFGMVGFKKHQRAADEVDQLAQQHNRRAAMLSAGTLHPSQQMARFNLLIWSGFQVTFFGVCVGVAAAAISRSRGGEGAQPAPAPQPVAAE